MSEEANKESKQIAEENLELESLGTTKIKVSGEGKPISKSADLDLNESESLLLEALADINSAYQSDINSSKSHKNFTSKVFEESINETFLEQETVGRNSHLEAFKAQEETHALQAKVMGMEKAIARLIKEADMTESMFDQQKNILRNENKELRVQTRYLKDQINSLEQKHKRIEINAQRNEQVKQDFINVKSEVQFLREEREAFSKKRENIRLYAKWLEQRVSKFSEEIEGIMKEFRLVLKDHPIIPFAQMLEKDIDKISKVIEQQKGFSKEYTKKLESHKRYLEHQQGNALKLLEKSRTKAKKRLERLSKELRSENLRSMKKFVLFKTGAGSQ